MLGVEGLEVEEVPQLPRQRQAVDVLPVVVPPDGEPTEALQVESQWHPVDRHARHLLVERTLAAVRHRQVRAGLREERE